MSCQRTLVPRRDSNRGPCDRQSGDISTRPRHLYTKMQQNIISHLAPLFLAQENEILIFIFVHTCIGANEMGLSASALITKQYSFIKELRNRNYREMRTGPSGTTFNWPDLCLYLQTSSSDPCSKLSHVFLDGDVKGRSPDVNNHI